MQRVLLGSDHAGLKLRTQLKWWCKEEGYAVFEFGATSSDAYGYPLAVDLTVDELLKHGGFGVLVCGSGIGMSIRANRYVGVRAALCLTPQMAELSRRHNHANVLCLGERLIEPSMAIKILKKFLETSVDLDVRHMDRINMLDDPI